VGEEGADNEGARLLSTAGSISHPLEIRFGPAAAKADSQGLWKTRGCAEHRCELAGQDAFGTNRKPPPPPRPDTDRLTMS